MQAALRDLSLARTNSQSFVICQRVLHKCHEIIFGDLHPPSTAPYAALALLPQSRFSRTKVKHNVEPSLIGIGIVLAGASAMPLLTEIVGQVAIEQGRAEEGANYRSVQAPDDETVAGQQSTQVIVDDDDEGDVDDKPDADEMHPAALVPHDTDNTIRPSVLTRRRTVGAAQTVPALPLHLRTIRRSRASEDPLGQMDTNNFAIPYLSTPSISSARPAPRSAAVNRVDALLEMYDEASQRQLLRSHYCRSEVCPTFRKLHPVIDIA